MSVWSVEEEEVVDEDVTRAEFDNVVENTRCHDTQRIIWIEPDEIVDDDDDDDDDDVL